MNSPKIFAGTAGWSYKDWVPNFYPKTQSARFDWLLFYAQYFNVVEVNASYYTYLNPAIIQSWIRKLNDHEDFCFTLKLHQDFTHKRSYARENITGFNMAAEPLLKANRLGGILIQFPYSFQYNETTLNYIINLSNVFDQYSKFVEVRHASWHNEIVFNTFNTHNLTFCTVDQPDINNSIKFDPVITNNKAYIRFHGRNTSAWKESINNFGKEQNYNEQNERYKYLYSPGELVEVEQQLREIYNRVREIYIIMNNHPTGYAVANAFELLSLLKGNIKMNIPQTTVKAFPRLERIAMN